jgi:hypothetical protein
MAFGIYTLIFKGGVGYMSKRENLAVKRVLFQRQARKIIMNIYSDIKMDRSFWRVHCVHHINGDPFNNDPNNLALILKKDHYLYHRHLKNLGSSREFFIKRPHHELTPAERNILITFLYNKGLTREIPQSIRA